RGAPPGGGPSRDGTPPPGGRPKHGGPSPVTPPHDGPQRGGPPGGGPQRDQTGPSPALPRRNVPQRGAPPRGGTGPSPVLPPRGHPPGRFSTWSRPSVRASWLGLHGEGIWESDTEPGYSVLATSDPSADATATQTWAAIDYAGDWSPPPLSRDVSTHTDGEG